MVWLANWVKAWSIIGQAQPDNSSRERISCSVNPWSRIWVMRVMIDGGWLSIGQKEVWLQCTEKGVLMSRMGELKRAEVMIKLLMRR